jgi:ComF family protein
MVLMRYSTAMQKTQHYKRYIPGFSLDVVVVGTDYDLDMQRRIHRFKYAHNPVDRVYFEELFAYMKEEYPCLPDIIVYPPISLRDRIFRGTNHAQLLAQYFRPAGIQVLCPFRKKLFASHQSHKTKSDRKNIQDVYSLHEKWSDQVSGKKILLIDDLITTGYTAHILGKLLKKA